MRSEYLPFNGRRLVWVGCSPGRSESDRVRSFKYLRQNTRHSTGNNKASVCVCVCVCVCFRCGAGPGESGPGRIRRGRKKCPAPLARRPSSPRQPKRLLLPPQSRRRRADPENIRLQPCTCPPGAGTSELFGAVGRGQAQGFGGDPRPSLPHTQKNISAKPEVPPISAIS